MSVKLEATPKNKKERRLARREAEFADGGLFAGLNFDKNFVKKRSIRTLRGLDIRFQFRPKLN